MIALALALLLAAAPAQGVRVPIPIDPIPPAPERIDILDDCAKGGGGAGGDIVVCGRPGEQGQYRLPESAGFDPDGPVDSVSRERNELLGPGPDGIGSCSPVGAGGMTGCMVQGWRRKEQQRAGQ